MRKFMLTALIAAVAMPVVAPVAASAQPQRHDQRDDRRDNRDDRRDHRNDRRDDRRDYRNDRRDNVQDRNHRWGRDDWRGYRNQNRALYARGNWRAPFRYNAFRNGVRIAPSYYASRYWISDPWRYRLPPVGYSQRWVRHYNDVILVDTRRGVVIDVIRNFYM